MKRECFLILITAVFSAQLAAKETRPEFHALKPLAKNAKKAPVERVPPPQQTIMVGTLQPNGEVKTTCEEIDNPAFTKYLRARERTKKGK